MRAGGLKAVWQAGLLAAAAAAALADASAAAAARVVWGRERE
jgi:hypothetical protein